MDHVTSRCVGLLPPTMVVAGEMDIQMLEMKGGGLLPDM